MNRKFEKISILNPMSISDKLIENLREYSAQPITAFITEAENDDEVIRRIGDSDCVLVSWNGKLNGMVLKKCSALRYVGLCSTLFTGESSNIDLDDAEDLGIEVRGISDYGDTGTVEFVISEIIAVFKGSNGFSRNGINCELGKSSVGIFGMGSLGKKIAKALLFFGAEVFYHSRSRKPDIERLGVEYLDKRKFLKTVDLISFNLPRNTEVMDEVDFDIFGNGKVLINTSLGCPFNINGFSKWISSDANYAIFDADGLSPYKEMFINHRNVRTVDFYSGYTIQAMERQVEKTVENIKNFLSV